MAKNWTVRLRTQRRVDARVRVIVLEQRVGSIKVVGGRLAGHGPAAPLGLPNQVGFARGGDVRHVQTRVLKPRKPAVPRDDRLLRGPGNPRQTQGLW